MSDCSKEVMKPKCNVVRSTNAIMPPLALTNVLSACNNGSKNLETYSTTLSFADFQRCQHRFISHNRPLKCKHLEILRVDLATFTRFATLHYT